MTELKDWISEIKTAKPELIDFITKLEGFISDAGFNTSKFDNAVAIGLQKKEVEVIKTFTDDAEN